MTARIGHLGQETRGRTARTGQPEQDRRDMETGPRKPGKDSRGRTARAGEAGQESKDWSV
jgi:hypothetical protein